MKTKLPPFYNLYPVFDKPVPLGFRGLYWDRPKRTIDRVDLASELLSGADNVNKFTVVYETTEGIFCRTIEEDALKEYNEQDGRWELTWEPIHIGQSLTIHKAFFIYKHWLVGRVPGIANMEVSAVNQILPQLNIDL
jgi:hypothetical protein